MFARNKNEKKVGDREVEDELEGASERERERERERES